MSKAEATRTVSRHGPPPLPIIPPLELENYSLDIQYYLRREYIDIGEAAIELPSIIEWVNFQVQAQLEEKYRKKAHLAQAEATAYFALKNGEYQRRGHGDKYNETSLAHAVTLDDAVKLLNEELAILSGYVDRLNNLSHSLQGKLDMVRSFEATRRQQLQ